MLVLSRKVGERVLLGDNIRITIVRVSGGGVRLGIEAPTDVAVVREEVATSDFVQKEAGKPDAVKSEVVVLENRNGTTNSRASDSGAPRRPK